MNSWRRPKKLCKSLWRKNALYCPEITKLKIYSQLNDLMLKIERMDALSKIFDDIHLHQSEYIYLKSIKADWSLSTS